MPLFEQSPAPILAPSPDAAWASGAAFNPAADLAPDGTVRLLVRGVAAGYERVPVPDAPPGEPAFRIDDYVSALGLALRRPDGAFALEPEPLLAPQSDVDRYGLEDARATRLGGTVYLTFTALSEPAYDTVHGAGLALASTTDWETVERHGRIGPPVRDKNAALFSREIGGRVGLLHRIEPSIQLAWFEDEEQLRAPGLEYWTRHLADLEDHVILRPETDWEGRKIGAGPPPIETEEGWLLVYHGVDDALVYRAGLALLDLDDPRRVIARTRRPVMEPVHPYEREGDVPNVVFPTGATVEAGTLTLYYGAADSSVGEATAPLEAVLSRVLEDRR